MKRLRNLLSESWPVLCAVAAVALLVGLGWAVSASAATATSTDNGMCTTPARGTLDNAMRFEATWTTRAELTRSLRHNTEGEIAKTSKLHGW